MSRIPKIINKLRNRESLKLFDNKNKYFVRIQLNKKSKFICWERWVSKDRNNWIKHNEYLSLKDIIQILGYKRTRNTHFSNKKSCMVHHFTYEKL